jgi:hypothetical protein
VNERDINEQEAYTQAGKVTGDGASEVSRYAPMVLMHCGKIKGCIYLKIKPIFFRRKDLSIIFLEKKYHTSLET